MEPTGVKRKLAVILTVAIAPLLAACETGPPAVSLEEAKQITATFEGSSFVPPPRTIKDITAILDKEKRADPAAAAKALAEANKEPPAGAPKDELASFYWQRGKAAGKIGDVRKQLTDLKEAVRLSKGTGGEPVQPGPGLAVLGTVGRPLDPQYSPGGRQNPHVQRALRRGGACPPRR